MKEYDLEKIDYIALSYIRSPLSAVNLLNQNRQKMKERDIVATAEIKQRWYQRKRKNWRAKVGVLSDKQIAEAELARLQKEAGDASNL